jgi:cell wall-associated NlpC family hydrolase
MGRPLTRGVRLALAVAAVALLPASLLPAVNAAADPSPQAQAQALAAQVARLQVAAEVATERYDEIEAKFGQAVTRHLLTQRELEQAQFAVTSSNQGYAQQARALYEDGGNLSLVAAVLEGGGLDDIAARYQYVVSILSSSHGVSARTAQLLRAAAAAERRLAALARQQTSLQVAASRAAAAVEADLAQTQSMLASVDSQIRELAAQQAALSAQLAAANASGTLKSALGGRFNSTTPPNTIAATAIAAARTKLGDPYVWGGAGPDVFDCSGLTQWAYAQAGVSLPRVAADQYSAGPHVPLSALQPGDLLFWATDVADPATIHHVAIYLGGGMMVEAPHTGSVVHIVPVYLDGYIGAVDPTAGLAASTGS